MQQPDYTSLKIVMERLEESNCLRRLLWAVIGVAGLFGPGYLAGNLHWIRWW